MRAEEETWINSFLPGGLFNSSCP